MFFGPYEKVLGFNSLFCPFHLARRAGRLLEISYFHSALGNSGEP